MKHAKGMGMKTDANQGECQHEVIPTDSSPNEDRAQAGLGPVHTGRPPDTIDESQGSGVWLTDK